MILWDSIFCDYQWIKEIVRNFSIILFLIGIWLDTLHLGNKEDSKPLYVALISSNISGDITYIKDLFFSYLKPYKHIESIYKIKFNNSIILNINNILNYLELILVNTK